MTINMMRIVMRRMVRMKSLTIFLPGETGRRNPTGLTHKSDETTLNHSQRRHLIRSTHTGRNWGKTNNRERKKNSLHYNLTQVQSLYSIIFSALTPHVQVIVLLGFSCHIGCFTRVPACVLDLSTVNLQTQNNYQINTILRFLN